VEAMTDPFTTQIQALCTIPGIAERTPQVIISEIGVDMSRFPTAAHLASWAGLCPGNNESAGKHGNTRTRKGNREIRTALVEAAWAAARTDTYLGAKFRRLHRRFGKKGGGKAAVAIAHDLIVIAWYVLHDGGEFYDLGPDYFTRPDNPATTRRKDYLIHELQTMGYTVQVTPAA
jgi:transposase